MAMMEAQQVLQQFREATEALSGPCPDGEMLGVSHMDAVAIFEARCLEPMPPGKDCGVHLQVARLTERHSVIDLWLDGKYRGMYVMYRDLLGTVHHLANVGVDHMEFDPTCPGGPGAMAYAREVAKLRTTGR